jgi:hypothetical protein
MAMKARSALILSSLALLLVFAPLSFGQATATLSPTSINFGPVQAGHSSTPQDVTLSNTGNAALDITSITFTGTNPADYSQTNNCGSSLAAGKQCTIAVTFTPQRTGIRRASLTVADNAANTPQTASMSGICQTGPTAFSPASVTFPDQAIGSTSASQTVTVSYIGTTALKITSIALNGGNPGDFSETNTCGTQMASGSTCTITVTFTPTANWARSSAVVMIDSAQGSPNVVGVSGNGVSGGTASFSPTTLSFTSQLAYSSSASKPVKLTNTGTAPLALININAAGDFSQTNNCPASIAAGASCTINVTFAPTYSGTRQGWIDVNLGDPAGLQTVLLKGTGTLPTVVAITPKSTSVTPNQTVQYTATISGTQSTNVTWSVDGVTGGNSTVGTISATGLYTPPATAGTHMVKAIDNAQTTQSATAPVVISTWPGTLTHHVDTYRTGLNSTEAALTTGNVNKTQFGKLFRYPVDAQIYAEPLWVPNVTINGIAHNVVYVTTENDSVYAFDADNGTANPNPLWHTSFINGTTVTAIPKDLVEVGLDLSPLVGTTSTPVIDPTLGVMFVEVRTWEQTASCPVVTNTNFVHKLHAISITTGQEMPGSPVCVTAQVAGTGYDNSGGIITFNTWRQNQRPALLLLNGVVYLGFGALEDIDYYHGWILGYNENTLEQVTVFNDTPNGQKGGIWQAGGGLLADSSGYIYTSTGNGTFDASTGGPDYGMSFMKFTPSGNTLTVDDYFTPFNQNYLNLEIINADLASAGPMLLPDQTGNIPHLAVACGKTGTIYLMNRDNLGKYNTSYDNVVQTLNTTVGVTSVPTGNWGTPAYFNGNIYLQGIDDPLRMYTLWQANSTANPLLSAAPMSVSPEAVGYPSPVAAVSANGTTNGIVWEIESDGAPSRPSTLRAYDAGNISHEIYNSGQAAGKRDQAGDGVKFATPTVANGKVYVPTSVELDVYGLLP